MRRHRLYFGIDSAPEARCRCILIGNAKDEDMVQTTNIFNGRETYSSMIFNAVDKYAETHGKTHLKTKEDYDKPVFDYYEPDNPDEYVLCVIDHISLISTERGWDLRNSIKKLSEYMKIIRNKYNYIPVVVQQQNTSTLSLDAFKAGKIRPTQSGCADSTDPPKD